MTDDFASAMVTVLPVILLVATVQFNELGKRAREVTHQLTTEALRDGWNEVRFVQQVERSPLIRRLRGLQAWWWAMLTIHVLAEVYLIGWLADDGRPAQPGFAVLVAMTACLGFLTIAAEVALMTAATTTEELRRLALVRARISQSRSDQ
jgi:hypothetical protein